MRPPLNPPPTTSRLPLYLPIPTHTMAFPPSATLLRARILPPLLLSTPFLLHQHSHRSRPILCDSPDPLTKITSDLKTTFARKDAPPAATVQQSGVGLNPKTIRQISLGSVLGLLGGLGVSVFSKPLAILFGLGVVVVQVRILDECD
jgi:hypothetical protein